MPLNYLLGAAASIGSSAYQNSQNRKSQARADQYNQAQWNRNNAYNDPTAQMQRLRKAGLNPNMIYGASPSSATGNSGAPSAPRKLVNHKMEDPSGSISNFANTEQKEVQTDNVKAQNTLLLQDAILKDISIQKNALAFNKDSDVYRFSVDASRLGTEKLAQTVNGLKLDNKLKKEGLADKLTTIKLSVDNAREQLTGEKLKNKIKTFETELHKLGLTPSDPAWIRIMTINKKELAKAADSIIVKRKEKF
jgi:hypothetical protein